MNIITGDNLQTLEALVSQGLKFDLVELDGPYMAGLEAGWDELQPAEYLDHYAKRLTLVRQVLNPGGAVFLFGYPEHVAEIKAWAHDTNTLYLRRWLTWYKQVTAHKGRKVETILFFLRGRPDEDAAREFGAMLRQQRESRGWTLGQVQAQAEKLGVSRPWWNRGGNLYFETGSGGQPGPDDLSVLARIFGFNPDEWAHVVQGSYEGLTEIDIITRNFPEETKELNENGLRSKPVGLYEYLFTPVKPKTPHPTALILYGGSGNAAIAAEALGYEATVCELSPVRADEIRKRAGKLVPKWRAKVQAKAGQQQLFTATQEGLW